MGHSKVVCKKCILHSSVPNVKIDDSGMCTYCKISESISPSFSDEFKKTMTAKMESIFTAVKNKKNTFDALVMFSGGKDSSYLLNLLKNKYGLNVLAYSMINPVVNDTASKNMEGMVKKLNVELIKFYLNEDIYKKYVSEGIKNPEKYNLTEYVGCEVCGFFTHWVGTKLAIMLGIPLVLDGMDAAQGGGIKEGSQYKQLMKNGIKPFGKLHDLFEDVFGEEYRHSIYGYDEEELLTKEIPTHISPLSFLEYEPKYSFSSIEKLGIDSKTYKTLLTNCELLYLFDYISYKRYDCDSYIRQYASGIRNDYNTLEQLGLSEDKKGTRLTRDDMMILLEEYKAVLNYAVENNLTNDSATEKDRQKIRELTKTCCSIYEKETIDTLVHRVLKLNEYADYFNINLKSLG